MSSFGQAALFLLCDIQTGVELQLVPFAGIPLIMETPSQSPGPKLNYPKSLLSGELVYREDVSEIPESTDCRDVRLLYSLIK